MDHLWAEVTGDLPDVESFVRTSFRLLAAAILGGIPGLQREFLGMPAGLRTHMLVSLGAAIFVLATVEAGASMNDTTRVIQGVATGIGFVGAGAILKSKNDKEIHGLTTAASIWLTAGLGVAIGLGRLWMAVLGTVMAVIILSVLRWAGDQIGPDEVRHRQAGETKD